MSQNKSVLVLMGGRRSGKRHGQQMAGLHIPSVLIDAISPTSYPASYPEDAVVALEYMATCIAAQSQIAGFDHAVAADRTVWIVRCKHGDRLLGIECIQCSRDSEQ